MFLFWHTFNANEQICGDLAAALSDGGVLPLAVTSRLAPPATFRMTPSDPVLERWLLDVAHLDTRIMPKTLDLLKAEEVFETNAVNLTNLHSKSAVVFILHWNAKAGDYFLESIKSLPSEQNINQKFNSWIKLVERWNPTDPFDSDTRSDHLIVFFNKDPDGDFYRNQVITVKRDSKVGGVTPKQAFAILRKLKEKQNAEQGAVVNP